MKKKLTSSAVIAQSGIVFGTSGARGLVTELSSVVCAAFTHAFIAVMKHSFSFCQVAIAIDNRPSSYKIAMACSAALKQLNIEVIYYGVIPTPALAYIAQEDQIPAIMVTGSHIPFDRNGLKFYRPDGEITKADETGIISAHIDFYEADALEKLTSSNRAADIYIERYTSLFETTWLTGKRIGIYEHSSAGRALYYQIFEKLGAEVIRLGSSDEFVPIDTEAVAECDKEKASLWVKQHQLDAIFSTDGDGDRPLVSDENGCWLRGDILGLLSASALNIEALSVPVSCNTSIELCNRFAHVSRTRIGSPYVIAEFSTLAQKFNTVAGFEANGGFLLGSDVTVNGKLLKALPTRDAVLPALMVLSAASEGRISNLVNLLPNRFTYSDRIQNFATVKSKMIIENGEVAPVELLSSLGLGKGKIKSVNKVDGLRITLDDGLIIHIRPSGNAPELRCYAEASTYFYAAECVSRVLGNISKM